jgi:deoxyadenosine/deoxycytidine kinase
MRFPILAESPWLRRTLHDAPPTPPIPSIRISLEGNIAAGKSTFLEILRKEFDVQTVAEPVSRWQNIPREDGGSDNLLDLFYSDPKRWAYTFQTFAFLSRMQAQMEPVQGNPGQVVVYERSVLSDKFIFAANCAQSGLFNSVEWALYRDWHEWLVNSFETNLDGIVYLRASPSTCLQRLHSRGRGEETSVPLTYLQELHDRHEEWLQPAKPHGSTATPSTKAAPMVLVLDAEGDILASPERGAANLEKTREFIALVRASRSAVSGPTGVPRA